MNKVRSDLTKCHEFQRRWLLIEVNIGAKFLRPSCPQRRKRKVLIEYKRMLQINK